MAKTSDTKLRAEIDLKQNTQDSVKRPLVIRPFHVNDSAAVITLWQACGLTRPWNDPQKDIDRKLTTQPELFFIGLIDEAVMASAMFGYDGHRGWVNYLAVAPDYQGHGYGKDIMQAGERALTALGCAKLNLQIRSDNLAAARFYQSAGYVPDDVVSFGKRLIADD